MSAKRGRIIRITFFSFNKKLFNLVLSEKTNKHGNLNMTFNNIFEVFLISKMHVY